MTAQRTKPCAWRACRAVLSAASAVAVALAAATAPAADAVGPGKVKIRPTHEAGRMLRYQLKVGGTTAWAPAAEGVDWGKLNTDFTFVLSTKTLRENGACTYSLLGEHLRSIGEGPKGAFGIDATRRRTQIKIKDLWQVSTDASPLTKPMTMTFGPLGGYRFGTGLLPLAPYMLEHVDPRFWTLLTIAPLKEVGPGDGWKETFDVSLPGSKGKPLRLTGSWRVLGWQSWQGRRVLAMTLEAEWTIKDTSVVIENGDALHVASGSYKAKGLARWDVANGVLCHAAADQKVLIKVDKPKPAAMRSECDCSVQLLGLKKPPATK